MSEANASNNDPLTQEELVKLHAISRVEPIISFQKAVRLKRQEGAELTPVESRLLEIIEKGYTMAHAALHALADAQGMELKDLGQDGEIEIFVRNTVDNPPAWVNPDELEALQAEVEAELRGLWAEFWSEADTTKGSLEDMLEALLGGDGLDDDDDV